MRRSCAAILILVVLGLGSGCGGPSIPITAGGNRDALDDLGQMLKSLTEEGRKPPASLAAFGEVEPLVPLAGPLIRDGSLVYFWGAGYVADGPSVIAHEKKTPTEGGLVLLQSGVVKELTAAEFKAAPKAKK